MLQHKSFLKIDDNTGIVLVYCIKVLGVSQRKIANLGDIILIVINKINKKKFKLKEHIRKYKRFKLGKICKACIIRTKINFKRINGMFIRFNENSAIIIGRKNMPISNRIKGPVLFELCRKNLSIGSIAQIII